jgi:hypothetical protein
MNTHTDMHTFLREWKEKDGGRKKQEAEMMNRLVDEQMQRMEAESEVTELKTALKKARSGKGGDDTTAKELQAMKAKCSESLFCLEMHACSSVQMHTTKSILSVNLILSSHLHENVLVRTL